jgi:hypothetical protein
MIPRLLVVVIFSQVYVSGCSQAVAPVPRGPALTSPSSLSRLAAGALPNADRGVLAQIGEVVLH